MARPVIGFTKPRNPLRISRWNGTLSKRTIKATKQSYYNKSKISMGRLMVINLCIMILIIARFVNPWITIRGIKNEL